MHLCYKHLDKPACLIIRLVIGICLICQMCRIKTRVVKTRSDLCDGIAKCAAQGRVAEGSGRELKEKNDDHEVEYDDDDDDNDAKTMETQKAL